MSMQYKALPMMGFKASGDGIVEAYVAIYGNVDSYNERIKFGAFKNSIESRRPGVVWSHDFQRPIGKTLEVREVPPGSDELPDAIKDNGGLYVKGQLALKTRDGLDMYEHLSFGSIQEFSFGFEVKNSQMGADGVTELTEIMIYEWSPVLVGANPKTQLIGVKSMDLSEKSELLDSLIADLSGHVKAYGDMKVKAGRTVSKNTHKRLSSVAASLKLAYREMDTFLKEHDPNRTDDGKSIERRKLALKAKFGMLSTNNQGT